MNISETVYNYAMRQGLDATATGGGCDFITKEVGLGCGKALSLVLSSHEDTGMSPDALTEPSEVTIYFTKPSEQGWWNGLTVSFATAQEDPVGLFVDWDGS